MSRAQTRSFERSSTPSLPNSTLDLKSFATSTGPWIGSFASDSRTFRINKFVDDCVLIEYHTSCSLSKIARLPFSPPIHLFICPSDSTHSFYPTPELTKRIGKGP